MSPRTTVKPKRHKKRKSRTEVSSDISSDSEPEATQVKSPSPAPETAQARKPTSPLSSGSSTSPEPSSKELTDKQVEAAFTKFYLTRATAEFADDLEKLRTSEGFRDEAVPMLISALQAGTSMFSAEEKRRVVLAGREVK